MTFKFESLTPDYRGFGNPIAVNFLCWLVAGGLSFFFAFNWLSGTDLGGDVVPTGIDAFYHARRILDTVNDPSAFYQFDDRMHVPEGSWIVWPWFYDWFVAHVIRLVISIDSSVDPKLVMVLIPPFWTFVNAGLLLTIGAQVGLRGIYQLALAICYALSPLTLQLHGAGRIDHHVAEQTMMFACLSSALLWTRKPDDLVRSTLFGFVLGGSVAIHNGLFLLQLPALITIFWCRCRGVYISRTAIFGFSSALLVSTLLVLFGSDPFYQFQFRFELLSWFHLYAAFATALLSVLIVRVPRTNGGIIGIVLVALALIIPMLEQVIWGVSFIGSKLEHYETLTEARSLMSMDQRTRIPVGEVIREYTGLVVLLPPVMIGAGLAILLARENASIVALASFTLFGALMLVQQHRFHQYGSFALYLPLLLATQRYLHVFRRYRIRVGALVLVPVLFFAHVPSFKYLSAPQAIAGSNYFHYIWPMLERLRSLCDDAPGLVLIDRNLGHHVRYFTDCTVLANNFLTTKQHFEKVAELDRALQGEPGSILDLQPAARYLVLIDNRFYGEQMLQLLHGKAGDFTPEIKAVELATTGNGNTIVYGGVFELFPRNDGAE